jgi:hemolysin activation/secretion protein
VDSSVVAQSVPNAGALMNNIEQSLKMQRNSAESISGFPPKLSIQRGEEFNVRVDSFVIKGNVLIDSDSIQDEIRPYIGLEISSQQLPSLTRRIESLYRDHGFNSVVYLPVQDLESHRLIIQIIENRSGTH